MATTPQETREVIMKPNEGFQAQFTASNVDVVFGGGNLGGGKSYAIVLAMAQALMTDGSFRGLISRKALGSLKVGGGFIDTFKEIFGRYVTMRESEQPRAIFPNGAFCDLTYIDDSNMDKLRERAKGWQYDVIAVDELTEMSWECFSYIITRNRGHSKVMTGKMFATLNPKRSHWTRQFLDWYIGVDGYIIPERNGRVRYFYNSGQDVKDVVWGETKEEVYRKCRIDIDRKLARIGGDFTYKNMIKSFVFYQGKLSENKALLDSNPDYLGSVAASGGKMSQALIEGNFNVDPDQASTATIPSDKARDCFINNPAVNGDKWITADLADFGTDNFLALAWNGFHVIDIMILGKTTPRDNAIRLKQFAKDKEIPESHIIYDATAGRYINDYIPDAMPFLSSTRPRGIYYLQAMTLKDLCYIRLVKMINKGNITFEEAVATSVYKHQNMKYDITVENEFLEECAVVHFDEMISGKRRLWTKKKMNQMLGHGRSMDLLDPCAMRMLPCVNIEYGRELQEGFEKEEEESVVEVGSGSIYDETLWY